MIPAMPTDTEPWLRLPTDTSKSFEAFIVYRDLGPSRTLQKAADMLRKSGGTVRRWASRHHWAERAAAFDQDQDKLWRKQVDAERHVVAKQHVRIQGVIIGRGVEALQQQDTSRFTPIDALRYLVEGMKSQAAYYGIGAAADQAQPITTIVVDHRLITPATLTRPPGPDGRPRE